MGITTDAGATEAGPKTLEDTTKGDDPASWTCPLSTECTKQESCYAKCINKASCDAITGKDATAAAALAQCQLDCDKKQNDATASDGGLPPPDGDLPSDQKTDTCTPSCADKECGPDGCGGSCGSCQSPEVCNTSINECVSSCTASCSGKQCGDDGCGGSCGSCGSGYTCDYTYQCKKDCTADCYGKQCGPDGCGGSCGNCSSGYYCDAASYVCKLNCSPSCSGKQCGDDGCGGSCGTCSSGTCNLSSGQCEPPASCTKKGFNFDLGVMQAVTETHTDSQVKWQLVTKRNHSPSYALYYGDSSAWNFAGSGTNSGVASLPSIAIPSSGSSTLTFWLYMDTETGSYDILTVKLGSTTLWAKASSSITMKSWQQITVNLSSVAGQTGQIKFTFDTIDSTSNTTEGVYVDDISIQLGC